MKHVSLALLILGVFSLGYDLSCHMLNAWAFSRSTVEQEGWLYEWWRDHAAQVWPYSKTPLARDLKWTVLHSITMLLFVLAWITKAT